MSDLDKHKMRIQSRVRNTRAGVDVTKNVDEISKLSDLDDQQDNKGHASPNLTFPRTLKRGDTQDED